jgi:DEAD/DEAH box helicase domain-containing protein
VVHFGTIRVRTQVTSFQRLLPSGEVLGIHRLDLPEQELVTRGVWWTIDENELFTEGLTPAALPGALHAAEHASIAMLPLVAQSDRWDVGGVSTALHPDTGLPTVVVYDGYPGGAGFAARAYAEAATWLMATRAAIAACACTDGCPACVQSPKCGNGNNPLDKAGAIVVLDRVLRDHR